MLFDSQGMYLLHVMATDVMPWHEESFCVGFDGGLIETKDTADIKEDWNIPGDPEQMLLMVKDWDPILTEVVKLIPKDCLIDYKLLWRDPVRKWVSDHGRVALVGDAAHPHLSTSGTGGAQAIEDAATIAVLLEKLGKGEIPLAMRAFEKLR